jgi:hypothetical protein
MRCSKSLAAVAAMGRRRFKNCDIVNQIIDYVK